MCIPPGILTYMKNDQLTQENGEVTDFKKKKSVKRFHVYRTRVLIFHKVPKFCFT